MNTQHKLRKLFSTEFLQSTAEHVARWTHPVDAQAMLRKIDPAQLDALRRKYLGADRKTGQRDSYKFADADYWIKINVERAQDLRLDRSEPLDILDLGCGAGWFLFVCKQLGHQVLGLDMDENELYREAIPLLGLTRVIHRINPFEPLPALGRRFDLVTAHCICFQRTRSADNGEWVQWGPKEWQFFLDDLRDHVLKPGGTLLLDFNPLAWRVYYPEETGELFRRLGARVFRSKVIFGAGTLDRRAGTGTGGL